MKPRERVIKTIEREDPDRVPLNAHLRPEALEKLYGHFGTRDDHVIYDKLGIDSIWVTMEEGESFKRKATLFSPFESPYGMWGLGPGYMIRHPDNVVEDEWGIKRRADSTGKYWHFVYHPLQDVTSVNDYEFPDINEAGRFDEAEKFMRKWGDKYFTIGGVLPGFMEWYWYLRGWKQFIRDLYTNPKFANDLFDKLLEFNLEMGKRLIELGVDSIGSGEDSGSQTGLFFSLPIWRKYFKPRYMKLYSDLKKRGAYIFYHSDGNIEQLIPDLIDVGVDILNPIQPECMEPGEIKELYGDKLTLDGAISVQETLPFGTTEDVKQEVINRIKILGRNKGYILGPTHVIGFDVPLENILMLFETAKEYGKY
ncbi:MAG: uroporphyrinogen decarboxylase family protein [Candidatus Hodarchaeota archaeon]